MWKKILPVLLGLVLFGLVISKGQVDLAKVWDQLLMVRWSYCPIVILAFLAMVYLKGIRWSYLLKMQGHQYSVWNCFLIYMTSLFWGNVTPGRAGDFMKVLYLKEDLKLSMGTGMTSVLVDRVFDLYLLLIMGCLGILTNNMSANPDMIRLVWIFFGFLVFATLLAFNRKIGEVLIKAVFQRVLGKQLKEKANQAFDDFHAGMEAFYSPKILIPILLSAASYLIYFWACTLLADSMGVHIPIFYIAFCISIVNIVSLLTFLGMGTRELALKFLFGLINLSVDQAMVYSALILVDGTLLFSILCFFCYLLKPVRSKKPE